MDDKDNWGSKEIAPGIRLIQGKLKDSGKWETQTVRFDASKFTVAEAKAWLAKHDEFKDYISFEAATGKTQGAFKAVYRMLDRFSPGSYKVEESQDGSVTIKGVPVLTPGEWTDSMQQTPLYYPPEVLAKYANNWDGFNVYSKHSHGEPRDATDVIATVQNPRWDNAAVLDGGKMGPAVVADLRYHCLTQKSKECLALAKAGLVACPSVEHDGVEVYNPKTDRYEAQSIRFSGLAQVEAGACADIRIMSRPALEPDADEKEKTSDMAGEGDEKVAALEKTVAEQKTAIDGAKGQIETLTKELSAAKAAHKEDLEKQECRLKALETAPPRSLSRQGSDTTQDDEEDIPQAYVDRKRGIVAKSSDDATGGDEEEE